MKEETVYKKCPLCEETKLESEYDFPHIFPQSCDNNKSVFGFSMEDIMNGEEIYKENGKPKGKYINQRGFGLRSICKKCNNYSGSHYTNAFIDFYKQGLTAYENRKSVSVDLSCKNIYPLRILKEIMMMFVIINHNNPLTGNFKDYLLNKENQNLPKDYNIYAYFTEDICRIASLALAQRNKYGEMIISSYSCVSYKPFGFVLTYNSLPSLKYDRICDIVAFSKYKYVEQEYLRLPLQVINNPASLNSPSEYMKHLIY